jgi:phosphoglycolate phosphatase
MKYKAVVYDLDGTLLDSVEDLADSMNNALERFGYPPHATEKYKYFVGDGMRTLVCRTIPADVQDEKTIGECLQVMKDEYGRRWAQKTKPYPGIPELLKAVQEKGLKMAVLSNKPHEFTGIIVEKLLVGNHFDLVIGERPGIPKKPDPTGALKIAETLKVLPAEILYLGDTNTDMKTANAAGMFAVGVLWGFRQADELIANGAKVLLRKPLDLLELLK